MARDGLNCGRGPQRTGPRVLVLDAGLLRRRFARGSGCRCPPGSAWQVPPDWDGSEYGSQRVPQTSANRPGAGAEIVPIPTGDARPTQAAAGAKLIISSDSCRKWTAMKAPLWRAFVVLNGGHSLGRDSVAPRGRAVVDDARMDISARCRRRSHLRTTCRRRGASGIGGCSTTLRSRYPDVVDDAVADPRATERIGSDPACWFRRCAIHGERRGDRRSRLRSRRVVSLWRSGGLHGRRAMGYRQIKWAYMESTSGPIADSSRARPSSGRATA